MPDARRSSAELPLPPGLPARVAEPARHADLEERPTRIQQAPAPVEPMVDEAARALVGAMLEHFELQDCIGRGGMGRVFRARDTRLDRIVALKVLSPDQGDDANRLLRFEQEARSAGRLDSPFFARVYHYGCDQGLWFIAMEFVDGDNLARIIAARGRLAADEALRIGMQIAYGLMHAEAQGVVHRDIKPSNIIVSADGAAKLVDMGLVRDLLHDGSVELTQTNMTLGTMDYISPEQANDPRNVDIRSDIYSLGCTLFHAVAGKPPYGEGSNLQKLLQHHQRQTPDVRDHAPDAPEEIAKLIRSMMAKDPDDRPQTGIQLIHRMQATAAALQVAVPTAALAVPTAPAPEWWQLQLAWWGPAVALLLGAGMFAWWPTEAPTDRPWEQTGVRPAVENQAPTKSAAANDSPRAPAPFAVVPPEADLAAAVAAAPKGAVLHLLGDEYLLTPKSSMDGPVGLLIDKPLEIRARSPARRVRLQFAAGVTASASGANPTLIAVRGVRLDLRQLWLEAPTDRPATLVRIENAEAVLTDCLLDRPIVGMSNAAAGSVALDLRGGAATAFDCRFLGGDRLLTTTGGETAASFWNCAVGPYRHVCWLAAAKSDVRWRQSSVTLGRDAFAAVEKPLGAALAVERCVFAAAPEATAPALVRAPADAILPDGLWRGSDNVYAGGVSRQMSVGGQLRTDDLERLKAWGFQDANSTRIAEWPWQTTFAVLAETADRDADWRPLYQRSDVAGGPAGVQTVSRAESPGSNGESNPSAPAILVVDPRPAMRRTAGAFGSLEEAVRAAPKGRPATIDLSRVDELKLRNVEIEDKTVTLTGRGAKRVTLAARGANDDSEPQGFLVRPNGKLTIQDVEWNVTLGPEKNAALFASFPGGTVLLSGARLRVDADGAENATAIFDPLTAGRSTRSFPATFEVERSELRTSGTVVRGFGEGWHAAVRQSVVGASGPLVRTLDGANGRLELDQSTLLLGGRLLEGRIESATAPPKPEVSIDMQRCAVIAVGAKPAPLADLGGARTATPEALRWRAEWNLIAGFAAVLRTNQTESDALESGGSKNYDLDAWAAAFGAVADRQLALPTPAGAPKAVWDPAPTGAALAELFPELAERFPPDETLGAPPP